MRSLRACIACGGTRLSSILNLGEQYVIDFVEGPQQESNGLKARLELVLCLTCGLVQLKDIVPRDSMYRRYWYRSGISPAMIRALGDVTRSAERIVQLEPNDIVVDIGANDGTLLRQYSRRDLCFVGFEPAKNLAELARDAGNVIDDYFNSAAFFDACPGRKAKVVTAIAMFYDVESPNEFLRDVRMVLDPNGLFIIQMNYLVTMLEQNTFDNVCHEHVAYYSLRTLSQLLERNGLEVFDVGLNDINGGSIRTYIRHKGSSAGGEASRNVRELIEHEMEKGLDEKKGYEEFVNNVGEIRRRLYGFISGEVANGKKILIIGASTRGNTILQYCGLNSKLILAAGDRNPEKWGKNIIGTGIPIMSREEARKENPDYFLVLPYGFIEEITKEEKEYIEANGKLIVPVPFPRLMSRDGEVRI
jgi:NDP-4-keto-2,6-dideoxyhexose 3-C-methyltransferase